MRGLRLILSGLIFLPLFAFSAGPAGADDPIGQVKTAAGTVSVVRAGATSKLATGDHVFQSDVVATGPDGSVGITFEDNTMMSLGPDSRLSLDQFSFDTTTHAGVFDASLKSGTLAVKSGQIVKQTPGAVLGVRGTEFVVRADGGGN